MESGGTNLFWVFCAAAIAGLLLIMFGGKKQAGAKDWPAGVQWGYLALVIGVFGILSDYMSFTAVMLVFVLITGLVWGLDKWVLAKKRAGAGLDEPGHLVDYARGFFPVILAVFLLRSFLVEPFQIPSSSMRPGLVVGDFLLVNKFTYGIRMPVLNNVVIPVHKVERGDVMVFNYPANPKINYIKRTIGLPGDVVDYHGKRLTVNGKPVPHVADGSYDYVEQGLGMSIHNEQYRETLGRKNFQSLVIPDMPPVSSDKVMDFPYRDHCHYDDDGFTCRVPEGHYFMMGDNRDNSLDSRYWGFVEDRLLVGKAFMIWMNFHDFSRVGKSVL